MDRVEAAEVAASVLEELRSRSYEDLLAELGDDVTTREIRAGSGVTYQVEVQAFWDSGESGDLRVTVSVDDGRWGSVLPVSHDFIIRPDGSFVGEPDERGPR